nr:ABC transporter substrate-binding protein [Glaciecola punicea]
MENKPSYLIFMWILLLFCPLISAQGALKTLKTLKTLEPLKAPLLIDTQAIDTKASVTQTQFTQLVQQARGQSVYFYAWGGDPQVNRYLQWVAQRVNTLYAINMQHVKLAQTSDAVSRVLAEASAGNTTAGQVDLLWINGLNFATMAQNNLLEAQWLGLLPNFALTNPDQNPAVTMDFGMPTNGMEAPWGKAALTFYYDSAHTSSPPKTLPALLRWSKLNPGRFTYAKPPDFLGLSFLKYALIILSQQQEPAILAQLYEPPTAQSQALVLAPLWQFLDQLHPYLWRKGQYFLSNGASIRRLVDDSELTLGFTFSGGDIPGAVERFELPLSIKSYAMKDGSLSNVHFVTIPFNAQHKAAAKVVANFLMSPEAQAKKQQPSNWGDRTVLDLSMLSPEQQLMFHPSKRHPSALPANNSSPSLSEPHPSWNAVITTQWEKRYGAKQ